MTSAADNPRFWDVIDGCRMMEAVMRELVAILVQQTPCAECGDPGAWPREEYRANLCRDCWHDRIWKGAWR